ncbi:DMT family transporter [Neorhizobium sp. NCHU2750]|uniref:DMT family transporter n=1 Tax=Neorhizobium sp. NCHU2750 TaxID=1825976 RepID=UPI000E750E37|nr:membrane protein [Neorhizobium sp. NCHU2750]
MFNRANVLKGMVAGFSLYAVVWLSAVALSMTTATETAFFPALNGLFAALIAWAFLRRSVSRVTWVGAIVASGGVFFVMWGVEGRLWGNSVALASAVAYTVYIYVAAWATKDETCDLWLIFGVELLTMIALGTIFSAQDLPSLSRQSETIYWTALYVGIVTTVVPTAISIFFQRYVSPVTTGFLYSIEPVWSAVFAGVWLGESLHLSSYVGGACIVAGAAIYTIDQARRHGSRSDPHPAISRKS